MRTTNRKRGRNAVVATEPEPTLKAEIASTATGKDGLKFEPRGRTER